jgi:hypothetical protein
MKLNVSEWRAQWQIPAVLAITVESGRLGVDHVRRENGGSRILQSLSLPRGAQRLLEDPEETGRELGALLVSRHVRERRCVVGVPPGWAMTASTDLPAVTGEDLRGFLELRAEREFPVPVSDLALAHSAYSLGDGKPKATLAGLPLKRLEAVKRMLDAAGCRAVSISLAVDPGLAEGRASGGGSVNVLVNGNHVDFVVAAGGGVVALRSLAGGTGDGAGQPGDMAGGVGRELRITVGRLPEEVRRQLQKARFVGRRASAEALLEATQDQLRRLGLQGIVPVPTGGSMGMTPDPEGGPGVAAVMAERHLQGRSLPFEFVARDTGPWQVWLRRFNTRRHRWVLAMAAVCVVFPALVLGVRSHQEKRLQAEWSGMRSAVTELETLQGRIRQFRPWFERTPVALTILGGLVAAFPETGEVWAKSVEIKENSSVVCSGFARTQGAWMDFLDRLRGQAGVVELQVQSVRGESPVQFALSYRWEAVHDK